MQIMTPTLVPPPPPSTATPDRRRQSFTATRLGQYLLHDVIPVILEQDPLMAHRVLRALLGSHDGGSVAESDPQLPTLGADVAIVTAEGVIVAEMKTPTPRRPKLVPPTKLAYVALPPKTQHDTASLTPAHRRVLQLLMDAPEPVTVAQLMKSSGLAKKTIENALSALRKKKLLA